MGSESSSSQVGSSAAAGLRAASLVLIVGTLALCAGGWTAWQVSRAQPRPLLDTDRRGIEDSLRFFLSLSAHLRASGGDARYADRLPADPGVTDELVGEVRLLALGRRVESPRLVKLELIEVRPTGLDGVEARTKEYWITEEQGTGRRPRSDVVPASYELRRRQGRWQVVSWDIELPGATAGGR